MKKFLTLLLIMSMLLALTACKKGKESHESTGTSTSITQGINSSTKGTHNNAGGETNPQQSTPSQDTHTHSYTAEVTAEATCNTEGTKTFTCSCGDTYTEAIPSQHSWSDWQVETFAMVGKPGTEKRTCSVCSVSESQERTANAIANSFFDIGFTYFARNDECKLTGPALVHYALNAYPEFRDTPVKSKTLFGKLMDYFPVTEQLMSDAKYWGALTGLYNEADDTFTIAYETNEIEDGNLTILGYVHQGENKYAVYFQCNNGIEDRYCEFVLEYNRPDGYCNYYVSSKIVKSLPDDMIKCSEGEQCDVIN